MMPANSLHDNVRFSLSDRSGVLRFTDFRLLGAGASRQLNVSVQEYVIGRALEEVDLDLLRGLPARSPDDGSYIMATLSLLGGCKRLFSRQVYPTISYQEDEPWRPSSEHDHSSASSSVCGASCCASDDG